MSTDQNSYEFGAELSHPLPPFNWPAEGASVESEPPVLQKGEPWQRLFHTYEELMAAPPLRFAIEGFLPEDGITLIGGPAGHGKTLLLLNIAKALLTGAPLFDFASFKINTASKRLLYLIPENALGPFRHRLELFGLCDFVKTGQLYVRTLSSQEPMDSLADQRLKEAVRGADIFLDTVIRFMKGDENSSGDNRDFAKLLFALQSAGARTILGAHHSPKGGVRRIREITLETALRGSGDVGAIASAAWAVKQTDRVSNRVLVTNVKARDFEACQPFEIEGRPHIEKTGTFKMLKRPGEVDGQFWKETNTADSCLVERAKEMKRKGLTDKEVAADLGISPRTLGRWRKGGKLSDTDAAMDKES